MRNTNTLEVTYDPYREGTLPSLEIEVANMNKNAKLFCERNAKANKAFEKILKIAIRHNEINAKLSAAISPIIRRMKENEYIK